MAAITLENVEKVYENGFHAVSDLSLEIADGEFLVLVGPSGCGKSTALRMIAGLETITGGRLLIDNADVTALEPKDRDIAMVFQSYALYPHLTVRENIAFALKLRKVPKEEIESRVTDAARILELTRELDRKPGQLSGGQRQRVAMGRAIVRQPKAFLMDEPLSNLDAKLRVQMRAEVSRLQHSLKTTTVYVTHDQVEAMTMGDRVAVLLGGVLQQVDSPQNLYDHPTNMFVGAFIGSPQMNQMRAVVRLSDSVASLQVGAQTLALPDSLLSSNARLRDYDGREVAIGIRPEHLEDAAIKDSTDLLTGEVVVREGLGSEVIVHVETGAVMLSAAGVDHEGPSVQAVVAKLDPATKLRVGDRASLAVDTGRLHFFDLESGLAIA